MKSQVYFIPVSSMDNQQVINQKLKYLIDESKVLDFIHKQDKVALKLHFGEEGNTGFVQPEHVRVVTDAAIFRGGDVFMSDTNTLYRGRRSNSKDHVSLAYEHGFTKEITHADLIIPDDAQEKNVVGVEINQKFDEIFCIGNTLVHLENLDEVETFIVQCYEMLNTGGEFIVQIVNYDRMIREEIKELPVIEDLDTGLKFIRTYEYGMEHVLFKGVIELPSGEKYEAENKLLPIGETELMSCLRIAGFTHIDLYGSFEREPLTEHASALVIKAIK